MRLFLFFFLFGLICFATDSGQLNICGLLYLYRLHLNPADGSHMKVRGVTWQMKAEAKPTGDPPGDQTR